VEAFALHARIGTAELLRRVRQDPAALVGDPSRELRAFRVAQFTTAGTKRGAGRGSFIDSVLDAIDAFYEQVIQNLKPWIPAPPRLRSDDGVEPIEPVRPSLVSTAISSQDGPETYRGVATVTYASNGGPPLSEPTAPTSVADNVDPDARVVTTHVTGATSTATSGDRVIATG
jgi:hypothetical protein